MSIKVYHYTLQRHYTITYSFWSFIVSILITIVSSIISPRYFINYRNGSISLQREWDNRVTSLLHAACCSFWAAKTTWQLTREEGKMPLVHLDDDWMGSESIGILMGIMMGYMIFDMIMMKLYSLFPKDRTTFCIHHSIICIGLTLSAITGYGSRYILVGLFHEMANVFLHCRWFLKACSQQQTPLYLVNLICLQLSYTLTRLVTTTLAEGVFLYNTIFQRKIRVMSTTLETTFFLVSIGFTLQQYYLWYKVSKVICPSIQEKYNAFSDRRKYQ
eukprot:gb/GECH01007098.1/.p1 GENE.gb/GECH01007098.1/~~gb/GECH01007098.1/.p1  ORF type:complete len:274 (+),score=28.38 gb/GECH01007098.1/:1-822(+)